MKVIHLETLRSIPNVERKLDAISVAMMRVHGEMDCAWPDSLLLDQSIVQSVHFLDTHLEHLSQTASVLLRTDNQTNIAAEDIETIFRMWQDDTNPPSLLSLCLFALEGLGVQPSLDDLNMLVISAILGQVHNPVIYHNDMHLRKVLAQTIRLIVNNNEIFDGTYRVFDVHDICLLLSAACIHDLGHDGCGNFVKGVHVAARAEQISFDYAMPYLKMVGCDKRTLQKIKVMLLSTDVSPLNDPVNPMMQMKAVYRFHYMGEHAKTHSLHLDKNLRLLEKDKNLATLCLLLHEADIATSAGVTYSVAQHETSLLMEELKDGEGHPSQLTTFIEQVCQQRFLSDAGQRLFASNMARIYALAQQDVESGDLAFKSSQSSAFITAQRQA